MNQTSLFNPFRAIYKLTLLITLSLLASMASAQNNKLLASLYTDGPVTPGQQVTFAIHFEPVSSEWHGYWENPGDAGLGMVLDWDLPDGWEPENPLYPVPERLMISGLMNHVYKGEYSVLIPVNIPEDYIFREPLEVAVSGEWLACTDTICVPEKGRLSTKVWPQIDDYPPDPRFSDWQASIAPLIESSAVFEADTDILRIGIPFPKETTIRSPHVFVSTKGVVDYAGIQTFYRNEDLLIAEIPRKGFDISNPVEGILSWNDGNGFRFVAQTGQLPASGELIIEGVLGLPSVFSLIFGAIVGGLLLNVMPCVFPILSLKAISLARAGISEGQAKEEAIFYTSGVVIATVSLGAVMLALRAAGEQIGWAFQLQSPPVVVFLLFLAVVITANLAEIFELPSFSFTKGGQQANAFATGLLASFVATPCTGPFMALAMGASLLLPTGYALLLFLALGFGLALPFLLIGIVPALRKSLPHPGPWMKNFRRLMALPMGLTALALIWLISRIGGQTFALFTLLVTFGIAIALFIVGKLQRKGKLAWPAFFLVFLPFSIFGAFALPTSFKEQSSTAVTSKLEPRLFSREELSGARSSGRPVFVWFTADWCVTCKVNESLAIENETTKAGFDDAGVISLVGDWTLRDAEIGSFLTEQRAAGVPLYLWYAPGKEAEKLPQILTQEILLQRAARDGNK